MSVLEQCLLLVALRDPDSAALAYSMHLPFSSAEAAAESVLRMLALLHRHGRHPPRLSSDPGAEAVTSDETAILRLFGAMGSGDYGLAALLLQWLVRPDGQAALGSAAARLARTTPALAA
ncbi:MAG: hypothetical protein ACRYHQ_32000 [Janthinobacterium lividum]